MCVWVCRCVHGCMCDGIEIMRERENMNISEMQREEREYAFGCVGAWMGACVQASEIAAACSHVLQTNQMTVRLLNTGCFATDYLLCCLSHRLALLHHQQSEVHQDRLDRYSIAPVCISCIAGHGHCVPGTGLCI